MEARVAALETDMKDVKGSLKGLELSAMRIEGRVEAILGTMATKADIAECIGLINGCNVSISSQERRLTAVEEAIRETIKVALGKSIGPGTAVAMLAAIMTIMVAGVGAVAWTIQHFRLA